MNVVTCSLSSPFTRCYHRARMRRTSRGLNTTEYQNYTWRNKQSANKQAFGCLDLAVLLSRLSVLKQRRIPA